MTLVSPSKITSLFSITFTINIKFIQLINLYIDIQYHLNLLFTLIDGYFYLDLFINAITFS